MTIKSKIKSLNILKPSPFIMQMRSHVNNNTNNFSKTLYLSHFNFINYVEGGRVNLGHS